MNDATTHALHSPRKGLRPEHANIRSAIAHAVHYLPTQGPISVFVHHNTLHSFEDLSFEEAVIVGGAMFNCEPYLSEIRYRHEMQAGRITSEDLRHVLLTDLGEDADALIASFGTRYTLRLVMLQMALHTAPVAELRWVLAETDLLRKFPSEISSLRREQMIQRTRQWVIANLGKHAPLVDSFIQKTKAEQIDSWSPHKCEAFTCELLWKICFDGIDRANVPTGLQPEALRHRDLLLAATGVDTDTMINEVLIRFCSVYLDQGLASWSLPDREKGFAKSFASLYLHSLSIDSVWMSRVKRELEVISEGSFDPLESISQSLDALSIEEHQRDEYIGLTLMSLRGWAGMIWQLESNTPWLPKPAPAGSFDEYLAIRLILERYAVSHVGQKYFRTWNLDEIKQTARESVRRNRETSTEQRTYTVFQLAQSCGWSPEQLVEMSEPQWACLIREIETFSSIERRRIFHLAYERHYRTEALDAIAIHTKRGKDNRTTPEPSTSSIPDFQAVFCIDDREESFRRHLEEVDPRCETASAAGFFAVAMYYQGADHAHYRPLCPNVIVPDHFVREEPLFSSIDVNQRRAQRRRRIGLLTHRLHAGSRTLTGGWITGVFGALATFPMIARIMAPRLTARIRTQFGVLMRPPATELHIERASAKPGTDDESLGYSLDEMSAIVVRILQDIGLIKNFPPIIVFFGHGSSSLNNPHESAYNCGACSGGRGGPNARAFAIMANDPRVRKLVCERGIELPDNVRFVGAYHNTCNDSVEYFDLDLLPRSHRALFRRIEASINEARARNAHERCRRFGSASLHLDYEEAIEHVEQRSEDLSEARPEYNHATNAMVIVGRREWSRGLFLDRRAFLTSYDPRIDDEGAMILTRILQAAIPVCAGINLEYYFSTVDEEGYGCGSKLPHNIASMLGVMTGASSDLRPGLSSQMVEIHEPMRILFVIETTSEKLLKIVNSNPGISKLVHGNWVQLAVIDPDNSEIELFVDGEFVPYAIDSSKLPIVDSSVQWYGGHRGHLGFASIHEGVQP